MSKIFGVNNRGAVVRWRALVSQDMQLLQAADELLKKCQRDIVFDPETVEVGMVGIILDMLTAGVNMSSGLY